MSLQTAEVHDGAERVAYLSDIGELEARVDAKLRSVHQTRAEDTQRVVDSEKRIKQLCISSIQVIVPQI